MTGTETALDRSAMDRRAVLGLAAAAASAPLAAQAAPAAESKTMPKTAGGRWSDAVIVNALGGVTNPNIGLTRPYGQDPDPKGTINQRLDVDDRVFRDARASGVNAVNVTLGYVSGPSDPFESSVADIGKWDELVRANPDHLLKVFTVGDILKAKTEGKTGLIYGFQNAAQIGAKPERVDIFGDLGVRIIQLTYNPRNVLGDGSMAPENKGLTPLGHEIVERLNARRIMVDLSHSGQQTCLDAARTSTRPISINHTGCRAVADLPRNKTDEELRLVASKGGFVGVYFMPFLKLDGHPHAEDVVAHIEHALNVCGEDHVGIGTDGNITGIDDLEFYKAHLAQEIEERRKTGIGATGERADTYPFVVDLRGVDQFYKLADMLAARGHSTARIEKILGGNFLAFGREIWGA